RLGPAGNDAVHRERRRLTALVAAVEFGAVDQRPAVVHRDLVGLLGRVPVAGIQHFVLQAARGRDHVGLLAVLGQELDGCRVIGLADRVHQVADVLAILVGERSLAANRVAHALRELLRVDQRRRHAAAAQLLAHRDADAVTGGARLRGRLLGGAGLRRSLFRGSGGRRSRGPRGGLLRSRERRAGNEHGDGSGVDDEAGAGAARRWRWQWVAFAGVGGGPGP